MRKLRLFLWVFLTLKPTSATLCDGYMRPESLPLPRHLFYVLRRRGKSRHKQRSNVESQSSVRPIPTNPATTPSLLGTLSIYFLFLNSEETPRASLINMAARPRSITIKAPGTAAWRWVRAPRRETTIAGPVQRGGDEAKEGVAVRSGAHFRLGMFPFGRFKVAATHKKKHTHKNTLIYFAYCFTLKPLTNIHFNGLSN